MAPIFLTNIWQNLAYCLFAFYRFLQFVLAITVCGLYGVDLNKADREGKYSDGKWVSFLIVLLLLAEREGGKEGMA